MANDESTTYKILTGFTTLLRVRRQEPLFHPNAGQLILNISKDVLL